MRTTTYRTIETREATYTDEGERLVYYDVEKQAADSPAFFEWESNTGREGIAAYMDPAAPWSRDW